MDYTVFITEQNASLYTRFLLRNKGKKETALRRFRVEAISIMFSSQTESKIMLTLQHLHGFYHLALFVVIEAIVKAIITEQEIAGFQSSEYANAA